MQERVLILLIESMFEPTPVIMIFLLLMKREFCNLNSYTYAVKACFYW